MKNIFDLEDDMNELYSKYKNDGDKLFLEMFPYPSGNLHVGHFRNYIFGDVLYRFKTFFKNEKYIRSIGWDAFGLPAENAAKQNNLSAKDWTENNIKNMKKDLLKISCLYDWSREINTTNKKYYKKTQELFMILKNHGFIYRKKTFVNWDPKDQTTLANEQVINGKGWRSGILVEKKIMNSWFFKLSYFSKKLYEELEQINDLNSSLLKWDKEIITIQKQWINEKKGYLISFFTEDKEIKIDCFTKCPEYLYNAQYIAISFETDFAIKYLENKKIEINFNNLDNLCIKTDIFVINEINNLKLPVYIVNYVKYEVGTGMIYGSPINNENDYNFCIKNKIDILPCKEEKTNINIINKLSKLNLIKTEIFYKLKDWNISRQRIWGCPIPIVICNVCGIQENINQEVYNKKFEYNNYNLLKNSELKGICAICKNEAILEIDSLDTFVCSSWYYLAYINNNFNNFSFEKSLNYLPVKYYIGGIEHANLHLLYSRSIIMALCEIFKKDNVTPFERIINQGMILNRSYRIENGNYITNEESKYLGCTSKIEKMSKSKKNTININDIVKSNSISALRIMIMSNYPINLTYVWDNNLLKSTEKFINKIINILELSPIKNKELIFKTDIDSQFINLFNECIEMYNSEKINIAISKIHSMISYLQKIKYEVYDFIPYLLCALYPIIPSISDFYFKQKYNFYLYETNFQSIYKIK